MYMIPRILKSTLLDLASKIPVLTIAGPRQSGKTTLARAAFPSYDYVNLEFEDTRAFAAQDPRGFLGSYTRGVVIDEIQRVPQLLSYIQGFADQSGRMGQYVITGSQNILRLNHITQSLAGRTIICNLLPLSLEELFSYGLGPGEYEQWIYKGFYPRLYDTDVPAAQWLSSYEQTYVERDVRLLLNVHDLAAFQTFLRLCAGRIGSVLNMTSLGNDAGVDAKTVKHWLSVLQTGFIVYLLQPYYKNYQKRHVKSPKLYFYDTGLACNLLGIRSADQLKTHYLKGGLFENFIINELQKNSLHRALKPAFFFWRDSNMHEVDLLIEQGNGLALIEIKSGRTVGDDFFSGIRFLAGLDQAPVVNASVLYGGTMRQKRGHIDVVPWQDVAKMIFA